jgi:hypothetical protein
MASGPYHFRKAEELLAEIEATPSGYRFRDTGQFGGLRKSGTGSSAKHRSEGCPLEDRRADTLEHSLASPAACGNAVS